MEIAEHAYGLSLIGAFEPTDAATLIAKIQQKDVTKLHCSYLSPEDGRSLADLLRDGIHPWLERRNRRLELVVVGSDETWGILTERLAGSRIRFVGTRYAPD